jgi:hypothetical protein
MNYKETLFFIGKCLTITHENHNTVLVEEELKSNNIDWDAVVKVSTSHYVFPALYCNLKRADFLHYLPTDLVEYMKHITDLNRERNQQIIEQAKEINELLLTNNITPIFLKGTGNLLEGLYDDIAERMVGDVDFLVSKNSMNKAVSLLKNVNYERTSKKLTSPVLQKHYPRLINKNKISAVEVHIRILRDSATNSFNYDRVINSIILKNNFSLLSYTDQLTLSTLANQYNDYGYLYKTISLRNTYDIYLLSIKTNNLNVLQKYKNLYKFLNPYFFISSKFLSTKKINYEKKIRNKLYLKILLCKLNSPFFAKLYHTTFKVLIFLFKKSLGAIRFIKNRDFRSYYIKKLKA